MIWKPHVTVAAVIERKGRFLLVEERVKGRTVYNQPAGHLESGESLAEAVIRETLEETTRAFAPDAVTGVYRWTIPDDAVTYLRVCFAGSCSDPDPSRPLDEGIVATHWFGPEELAARREQLRSPLVMACIEDYLAGKRYPLSLLTDVS